MFFFFCVVFSTCTESPYHNVSGLPDPYMESDVVDHHDHNKPQVLVNPNGNGGHLSFDESLESGYSTPNSRNRRVIREIIV